MLEPEPDNVRLERRVARERRGRLEAERLLEAKSLELYQANQQLRQLMADLEIRLDELGIARARAIQLAEQDTLTELCNRKKFLEILAQAFAERTVHDDGFTLFLLDVDRFKHINDTFGHGAGDHILRALAARLVRAVGPGATVARLGGDEFAILYQGASPDIVGALSERMIAAATQSVLYEGQVISSSCSIGLASCPGHADNGFDLQRFADLALYRSKAGGRCAYTVFDAAMKDEMQQRLALAAEIEHAIQQNQIEPWFQSIVDARTRRVVGVEALARWRHPTRGILTPVAFIGLVESCGLMEPLFNAMLGATCVIASPWIAAGLIDNVAVNVSPSQFRRPAFAADIIQRLADLDFPPDRLSMEITEEVLIQDMAGASQEMETLAKSGIRLAIDDFGAGYANIGYLRRLPIKTLKLDRLLTAAITTDDKAKAVLGGLIEIAKGLALDVVAEGVETVEDATALTQLGCTYLQGYLFGRPAPAELWLTGILNRNLGPAGAGAQD